MKIDEAISLLKQYIDYNNPDVPDFYTMEEACKVVIEALENQPTDAVDRVKIKEYLSSYEVSQPKMGQWIKCIDDNGSSYYLCSACRCGEDFEFDFCPNCGSDNREVKE